MFTVPNLLWSHAHPQKKKKGVYSSLRVTSAKEVSLITPKKKKVSLKCLRTWFTNHGCDSNFEVGFSKPEP